MCVFVTVKLPSEQPTPVEERTTPPAPIPAPRTQVTMRPSVTVTSSVTIIDDKPPTPPSSHPPPTQEGDEENHFNREGDVSKRIVSKCPIIYTTFPF